MRLPPAWTGLLVFAVVLMALEWAAAGRVSWLAVRMLVVAAAACLLFRAIPWARLLELAPPRSRLFRFALFFVFLSHFAGVLAQEAWRMFIAWRMAVPRGLGPGGFRSLAWATAGLFERSLVRAERFYAALVAGEKAA